MDLKEVLELGREYFEGYQLLSLVMLWLAVKYVFAPFRELLREITKIFKPSTIVNPKTGEIESKSIRSEMIGFMEALIETLHERTYSSRGIEKALRDINDTLSQN